MGHEERKIYQKCAKMKVRSTLLQRQKRSGSEDKKKKGEEAALREDSGCGDVRLG